MTEKYFNQSIRKYDLDDLLFKRMEIVELMYRFEDENLIKALKYNKNAMNLTLIIISEFGANYGEYKVFRNLAEKSIEYEYKLNGGFFNK